MCLKINETETFESFQTKQKKKINQHLNCNDKCNDNCNGNLSVVLWSLWSTICRLYNWQISLPLEQLKNDKKALKGEKYMQLELFEHFSADVHNCFLSYCSITLIDKTIVTRNENIICKYGPFNRNLYIMLKFTERLKTQGITLNEHGFPWRQSAIYR